MLKLRFYRLLHIILLSFAICHLPFAISAYALNLEKLKVYFLQGDYRLAVIEGEKILANAKPSFGLDELYYILGLSYLKDGNYLRASDIFEIILKEFKESKFKEEAEVSLGDTYFLRGGFDRAENCYQALIKNNPQTKLKALIFWRLSQICFKRGDTAAGTEYLEKLKQGFPSSLESGLSNDLTGGMNTDFYYTVQVGAFSSISNAKNFTQKLIRDGYPAYTEEAGYQGKVSYRVRVGKFRLRQEAIKFENKLSQEGYPTKVYP